MSKERAPSETNEYWESYLEYLEEKVERLTMASADIDLIMQRYVPITGIDIPLDQHPALNLLRGVVDDLD